MRGEGLDIERPETCFQRAFERGIADDRVDVARLEQMLHHVKDEQRPHAVIGKPFPHLRRQQESKSARMAVQVALTGGGLVPLGGSGSYPHIGIPTRW